MITMVLLNQIIVMFLLMGVGIVLYRKKLLSEQGAKDLGAILIKVIIPCVIIKSYFIKFSIEKLEELAISGGLSLLSLLIAMAVAGFIYKKNKKIENFAASFSNAGFIGIPLVQAAFGDSAVFYIASYIALLNLFQWTYGVFIITENRDAIKLKKIICNPVFISLIVGIGIFVLNIPIPETIKRTVGFIAGMNSPVAMIILGVYLSKIEIKSIFTNKDIYFCILLRVIIIPVITLFIFYFLPIGNMLIIMIILIAACTPVGANIVIFAQQYDKDYLLSLKTVCLSTVISIITIPLFFMLVQIIY